MTRPRCLNCGAGIRKKTETVGFWQNAEDAPRSLDECRQRTNAQIVSVRYWPSGQVMQFSTWDGESYAPIYGHFCKGECAGLFAWKMANKGARL